MPLDIERHQAINAEGKHILHSTCSTAISWQACIQHSVWLFTQMTSSMEQKTVVLAEDAELSLTASARTLGEEILCRVDKNVRFQAFQECYLSDWLAVTFSSLRITIVLVQKQNSTSTTDTLPCSDCPWKRVRHIEAHATSRTDCLFLHDFCIFLRDCFPNWKSCRRVLLLLCIVPWLICLCATCILISAMSQRLHCKTLIMLSLMTLLIIRSKLILRR